MKHPLQYYHNKGSFCIIFQHYSLVQHAGLAHIFLLSKLSTYVRNISGSDFQNKPSDIQKTSDIQKNSDIQKTSFSKNSFI